MGVKVPELGFCMFYAEKLTLKQKGYFHVEKTIVYFYFRRVKVKVMFLHLTVIGGYECKHSGRKWFHQLEPPRKALADQSYLSENIQGRF